MDLTKSLSAGLLILAFAAAPLAAATAPAPRNCDALKQWALDHRGELPRDYQGLLAYEMSERRAIYGNLSAEEKVAFWQQKLAAYVADHRELSAAQVAAIGQASSAFRPEIYGLGAGSEPLAEAEKEARAALGDKIAQEIFYGLGPDKAAAAGLAGPAQSGLLDTCNCASIVDCPRPMFNQCDPYWGCTGGTPTGCGVGGTKPCSKLCTWVP